MDIVPEIACTCGQIIPADRDSCPYCGAAVKSYWYDHLGDLKRAVPFTENGKQYLYTDGKKLSLDNQLDIPRPLQPYLGKQPDDYPRAMAESHRGRMILGFIKRFLALQFG